MYYIDMILRNDKWKVIGITPEIDNLELKITANEDDIKSLNGSINQINFNKT